MTLTTDIDRIEAALIEAYNNPGTTERVFAQKGLNEFRVMRYLERKGILTAAGAWIGPEPTRTLAGWVREECGALKPVKAKRTVQARVEPDPVETITVKAKPAKVKPVREPTPDAPPVDPNWVKAQNWKQTNVKTRAQWLEHLKKILDAEGYRIVYAIYKPQTRRKRAIFSRYSLTPDFQGGEWGDVVGVRPEYFEKWKQLTGISG